MDLMVHVQDSPFPFPCHLSASTPLLGTSLIMGGSSQTVLTAGIASPTQSRSDVNVKAPSQGDYSIFTSFTDIVASYSRTSQQRTESHCHCKWYFASPVHVPF